DGEGYDQAEQGGRVRPAADPLHGPLQAAHRPRANWLAAQPAAQVVPELAGRLVAVLRLLGHRPQTDRLEVVGNLRVELPWRLRSIVQPGMHQHPRVALERHLAGQELVQDDPETVDIAPAIDLVALAPSLFGTHVRGRAEDLPLDGQRRFPGLTLGEAEVHDP